MVSPWVAGLAPTIGREPELLALRAAFASHRVRVLSGMGGVGKTNLARAYAQRHLDDYGIVWWVRAEDPSAIDAEFRALLEVLLPPEAAKVRDARTTAFALLAREEKPWLLVLDNVPDAESAQGLIPASGNGHVLITTRATAWPDPTPVRPLDASAAIELLTTQSGDDDRDAAEALATELGGLPLALTQAAGFARTNAMTLATYLRLYRDRSAELHAEGRPADYPHTVATTWRLAIDRLTERARDILNLFAFYAPDAIPVHQLMSGLDELTRHRAVGELAAYSLITLADSTVSVHRLVQAVTREQLDEEWVSRAHIQLTAAIPEQSATAESLAAWHTVRTHVRALLDHLPPEHPDTLRTWSTLASWTGHTGDVKQARDLNDDLFLTRVRVLGAEHPDTLDTRAALAYFIGELGDAVGAREMFAALLPAMARTSGETHPKTLAVRSMLAKWTGHAGDAAQARDLFAELRPIVERVLGDEHPDTLITRSMLASWIGEAGDVTRARDLLMELVPIMEGALGGEDPVTLVTRRSLAVWIGLAGDMPGARNLITELLPTMVRVLGEESPDTLVARYKVAFFTEDASRARDLYAELLPVMTRVLGGQHPDTLHTQEQLSLTDASEEPLP